MAVNTNNFYLRVLRGNNEDLVRIIKETDFDVEQLEREVETFRYYQTRANNLINQPNPTDRDREESSDWAFMAHDVMKKIEPMVYPLFEKMIQLGYEAQELKS